MNDFDFSLSDIWGVVLLRWKLVVTGGALGFGAAVTAALIMKPVYRAEVLLAPATTDALESGIAGQLGGLASLAGISLKGQDNRRVEAIATLQSRALTEQFVADRTLLPILFAPKWDAGRQEWKSRDPEDVPTLWDANRLFSKKIRHVIEDKRTGLLTLQIDWIDPKLAADWARELVTRTNRLLRERAIARSQSNIKYLEEQLGRTSMVEVRQAIYRLTENEIKSIMLAQTSEEYAFKVIDPPVIPEERFAPKRLAFAIVGLLGGLFGAAVVAFFLGPPVDRAQASA